MMDLQEFEPIFGEAKSESGSSDSSPLGPFLFLVYASDSSHLKFIVTDFRSNTFEVVRSLLQLEDMRDSIGIEGSWSEFVDYIIASFKSEDVKLVLERPPKSDGAGRAKLIAQKSKGMPQISTSLAKLVDAAASETIATLSLELFKVFKSMQHLSGQEKKHPYGSMELTSTEKEDCHTPFFGDDDTYQPVTLPFVSPLDLDGIGEDQSIGTSLAKTTPSMYASGSSGKRSRIESTSRSRKKALEVRAETNSKFEKCIEAMQSHFEKKQSVSVDQTYDDAMATLLALNLRDEDDALLYFGIQLFESRAQRCLFVRTPEHKRLGYLRFIYAMRTGEGAS